MPMPFFVLLLALPAFAGEWCEELKDVSIPMRDGKALAADVYLPATSGAYPAVLVQTPYGKSRLGAVMNLEAVPAGEAGRGALSDLKVLLDRAHYAYVFVDWRGFYGSKAALSPLRPVGLKRGLDGYDCVEWIAKQSWCNGKVGTWGGSALGKQQLDTAVEQPPHLVCCAPLIAPMGQEYAMYYEGGVLLEGHLKMLDQLGFGVSRKVLAAPLPSAPAWKLAVRATYHPEAIEVPCLMITGWWDHFPDLVVRTFEDIVAKGGLAAKSGSRLLIGPWDHVSIGIGDQGCLKFEKAALESGRAAKAFFDFWLRGAKDNGWDQTPRVRYWTVNEEAWKTCEAWTAVPREIRTYCLTTEGRLVAEQPPPGTSKTWTFDPADPSPTLGGANLPPLKHGPTDHSALSTRKDGAWFTTGKLEKPLRVNGNVQLTVSFETNVADCDFTARLCDAGPDGKPVLICDAAGRAKLRDGRAAGDPLESGKSYSLSLRFPATATTFPEGHALMVYLANTNWPRYERNTGTGVDHWDQQAALPGKTTVHFGATELRIPLLKE